MEEAGSSVLIGFMGDVMLGRLVNQKISASGYEYPWGNTLAILHKNDLNVINLESTFTHSVKLVPKVFNFKADPDKVESLKKANIHIVNLANNHILDFSFEGMFETIKVLEQSGIKFTGAGKNIKEASEKAETICNGLKICVLGCTDNEPFWKANKNKPGTNYIDIENKNDVQEMLDRIVVGKETSDFLVVSIHWGYNLVERPSEHFVNFAHLMIDHGADIVHGHSAHIFQGIEIYRNKLIMYDTGDFVDDYAVTPGLWNDRSLLFNCEIDKTGIKSLKLYPVEINNMQVNLATDSIYDWILARIQLLSSEFGTVINDDCEVVFE